MFLVVLAYAILASTFTVAKIVLSYAKPFFVIGFRMVLSGIFLLTFLRLTSKNRILPKRRDLFLFFKVTLFHIYLAFIFEFWALAKMASSKVTLIYSITPFVAAIFSYFLLREHLGWRKLLGMVLGFLGLLPVLFVKNYSEGGEFLRFSGREIILLFAVVSATYAWFVIKELMQKNYSFLMINGISMFCGGVLAFITSLVFEGVKTSPIYNFWPFLGWLLLLILLANVVFYNLYAWLLKQYSITFLTFAGLLTPIFGSFYGWFFLGEKITWHYFLSLGVVSFAVYLFYSKKCKWLFN